MDETPLWLVEDQDTLRRCAERLGGSRVIGVDTESDSFHHYQEKVCLLQFSDMDTDYIVDPLALDMELEPLAKVFANRDVVKVFHGADYDIVCLKRDFGFEIRNIFDTMISAQQLGLGRVGLADLIGEFFGVDVDKKYQRHDWAERPLRAEHIEYARGDTHYLLALREILARRLQRSGRLERVAEECRLLEEREWEGRSFDEDGWQRIKTAGVQLDDPAKRVLKRLYLYRDEQARRMDRPAFKVIPDPVLIEVAVDKPTTESELDRLFPRAKIAMKRRHMTGFLDAVNKGLLDDWPIPRPKGRGRPEKGPPARLTGRIAERAMNALKEWRNKLVNAVPNTNPVAVVSNSTLKSIVRSRPYDLAELAVVDEVRQWQVEAYGSAILAVLDEAAPKGQVDTADEGEGEGENGRKRRRRRRR